VIRAESLIIVAACAVGSGLLACAPGVTPASAWSQLVGTVKADLAAHDGAVQIATDIATDLGQDVAPVDYVIADDILTFLEDVGDATALAAKDTVHAQVHALAIAAKAKP
jgi:hypothetical protein